MRANNCAGAGLLAAALCLSLVAGCGESAPKVPEVPKAGQPQPAAAAAAAPGQPAPGAEEPGASVEAYLRGRLSLYPGSAMWKNRLGRYLEGRGQVDEGLLLLEQAAMVDPANPDFQIDVLAARERKGATMDSFASRELLATLGGGAMVAPAGASAVMAQTAPPAPAPGGTGPAGVPPAPPGAPTAAATAMAAPPGMPGGAVATATRPAMPGAMAAPPGMPGGAVAMANQPAMPGAMAAPPDPTAIAPPAPPPPASAEDAIAQAEDAVARGDLGAAIISYQNALRMRPESSQAYLGLADTKLMSGDSATAINYYKEAMRLAPEDSLAAKKLGDACFQTRQTDCAMSAYEAAVKGSPAAEDGYVWVRYAHVAAKNGRMDVARRALAKAESILPADDRDLQVVKSQLADEAKPK